MPCKLYIIKKGLKFISPFFIVVEIYIYSMKRHQPNGSSMSPYWMPVMNR